MGDPGKQVVLLPGLTGPPSKQKTNYPGKDTGDNLREDGTLGSEDGRLEFLLYLNRK